MHRFRWRLWLAVMILVTTAGGMPEQFAGLAQAQSGAVEQFTNGLFLPAIHNGPPPILPIRAAAMGSGHTCAVTAARGVKCWGNNYFGQLGDGTGGDAITPVDVVGLASGVQAIAAGSVHTCALTATGGVKCWGYNRSGRLGDGTEGDENRSVTPVDVIGLSSGVQAITAGEATTCALTAGGGVKCWGWNYYGQLGDGTFGNDQYRLTPVDVVGLSSGVQAITTSGNHTCALTIGGGVKCWGYNEYGQLGDGTTGDENYRRLTPVDVVGLSSDVRAIAAGGAHTCALSNDGGVKCWGHNGHWQLGNGTTDTDEFHVTPVDVVGLASGVAVVAAAGLHTCALTAGGVKCWGWNYYGQLGDGTRGDASTLVDVVGLSSGVISIAAGSEHTCALVKGGGVKCWGYNEYGQLGDGTTGGDDSLSLSPVSVIWPRP